MELATHGIDGVTVEARLELQVEALDQIGAGLSGRKVKRSEESRTEIGRVGHQRDTAGFRESRHLAELGDAADFGDARLRIGDGARGEHGLELEGRAGILAGGDRDRSEEHTSELQSHSFISY